MHCGRLFGWNLKENQKKAAISEKKPFFLIFRHSHLLEQIMPAVTLSLRHVANEGLKRPLKRPKGGQSIAVHVPTSIGNSTVPQKVKSKDPTK